MAKELEIRIREEVRNVSLFPGVEVVHADDLISLVKQALAKVRSEKSGSPGHQNTLLTLH
jgi:hypothetical protein